MNPARPSRPPGRSARLCFDGLRPVRLPYAVMALALGLPAAHDSAAAERATGCGYHSALAHAATVPAREI